MTNATMLKREPVQVPLWRIVKLVESDTSDESYAYDVIAESAEEYTADEIEVFEQIHGKGLIQEKTYEYI
ncbi:hypothetical protein MPK67_gp208 [Erwinia phage pEa_SNUABM_32]|uniref:Uncharacterized protein n=1 Tax=Erwinia phage pEa_SNUABM_32 TaxID=2869555 RepID=A0AAE7XIX7_9CAUD|nr:hypothetical protein MPK67_gp208 [Erwinia phage pEa_SNUABM_32]QZE57081.1 hypothetical protein pEaSNUABM32_00208 [Erwinia phage pEa_SNUABM_32]